MRAMYQEHYGEPDEVLEVREVDRPVVADDTVLVRVAAASIHIGDCHIIRGLPRSMRPIYGFGRPRSPVPGTDMAGTVEAIGDEVTGFGVGDEVFGSCTGAFAEYAVAKPDGLAPRPDALDLTQASAVGVSAQTALQALKDHLDVKSGQRVLITGASGGVGSFAVQIAKAFGAEVTGVCSTPNVELVESLGADHVIDYSAQDFTQAAERYDRILDNVAAWPMSRVRGVLTPDGRLLTNGARVGGWFGGLGGVIGSSIMSVVNRQQVRPFVSVDTAADRLTLRQMIDAGEVRPVVDRTFPLDEGAQAIARVAAGRGRAKTVIVM